MAKFNYGTMIEGDIKGCFCKFLEETNGKPVFFNREQGLPMLTINGNKKWLTHSM